MLVNGNKISYTEVAAEFARNPPRLSFQNTPLPRGGLRIRNKRIEADVITIPIILSRRDTGVSWEEVMTQITSEIYREDSVKISFSHGDGKYYLAHVVAIYFTEQHEFVARGVVEIITESGLMNSATSKEISLAPTYNTFTIGGQAETPWTSYTRFSVPQSQYILENNQDGKIILSYSFIAGDILEIDYFKRKITLNGNNLAVALSLSSHWFDLKPGFAYLRASHATTLKYDERYY